MFRCRFEREKESLGLCEFIIPRLCSNCNPFPPKTRKGIVSGTPAPPEKKSPPRPGAARRGRKRTASARALPFRLLFARARTRRSPTQKSGRPDGGKPRRGRGVRFRRRTGQDLQRSVDGKTTGRFGGNGESGGKRYAMRGGQRRAKKEPGRATRRRFRRHAPRSPEKAAEQIGSFRAFVAVRVFYFSLLTNAQTSAIIRSVNAASPSGKATDSDSVIT